GGGGPPAGAGGGGGEGGSAGTGAGGKPAPEWEGPPGRTAGAGERGPLLRALEEAGVPATPVNTVDQVMEDPQTSARGMIDRVVHPKLGEIPVVSTPVKFSAMKAGVRTAAALRGPDNDAALAQLGYSAAEIAALRAKNVVV